MSHLDEGTLHALLDGELEGHEVAEIQAHLGSCSSCGLRLREVKEFLGEADRLIASVDAGPTVAPRVPRQESAPTAAAPPVSPAPHTAPRREPEPRTEDPVHPPEKAGEWQPWNEQVPVILVPDNESPAERRRRVVRRFGWAAMVLILIGAGIVGRMSRPVPQHAPPQSPASLARADSSAVVSPEEATRQDEPAPAQSSRSPSGGLSKPATPANSELAAKPAPKPVRKPAAPAPAPVAEAAPQDQQVAGDTSRDEAAPSADSEPTVGAAEARGDTAGGEDLATVRRRASEALAQLDRDKRRNQAAAATAALDAEKRRRATQTPQAAAAPAPTPPAPPTAEERARVYLRIGLDEASRQLGGPAHVIEGMSPMFMGLSQGVAVAGADATRPVVRVVYQDAQGRLIFLDQQRLRPGQATPPSTPLSWALGDTAIWLHGEVAGEILRTYRARVR
jgi:hypothetical protein